jgi:hypothetical protein
VIPDLAEDRNTRCQTTGSPMQLPGETARHTTRVLAQAISKAATPIQDLRHSSNLTSPKRQARWCEISHEGRGANDQMIQNNLITVANHRRHLPPKTDGSQGPHGSETQGRRGFE